MMNLSGILLNDQQGYAGGRNGSSGQTEVTAENYHVQREYYNSSATRTWLNELGLEVSESSASEEDNLSQCSVSSSEFRQVVENLHTVYGVRERFGISSSIALYSSRNYRHYLNQTKTLKRLVFLVSKYSISGAFPPESSTDADADAILSSRASTTSLLRQAFDAIGSGFNGGLSQDHDCFTMVSSLVSDSTSDDGTEWNSPSESSPRSELSASTPATATSAGDFYILQI